MSLSECVGRVTLDGGRTGEVFASVDATYHADRHEVEVKRSAHVSPDDMEHIGEHLRPEWLPQGEPVRAGCDPSEAGDLARDVFHAWIRHVRDALPGVEKD